MKNLLQKLEEKTEDQRRAEFRKHHPEFDLLMKANDAFEPVKDAILVSSNKKSAPRRLTTFEAHKLMKMGYIEKLYDSEFKGTAYFAGFTPKGERVFRNLWDEWIDLAYEDVGEDSDSLAEAAGSRGAFEARAATLTREIGEAYNSAVDLKGEFDKMEEIPKDLYKMYDRTIKVMNMLGDAKQKAYQTQMELKRIR